ncbi:adventurous gliding motility protein GltJ [Archangium sp.]|uniref:adventurous gliding motility protein GltJ n=1 Tax=Archangium sp. TaxID=1872627 RepID=UPI002D2A205D|nr:adventurous gliding motility protein GltJ [Archangium sp.]HYO58137.1 adventurous gliding motility protein GltJ [Archangium sp.]
MRFVCDSCRAQYMISDDKVGAKGVKVRCKKCGYNIVVRPAGSASAKEEGTSGEAAGGAAASEAPSNNDGFGLPPTLGTPPEGGIFSGVEDDELGAVFDQVLNSGSHRIPAGEAAGDSPAQLDAAALSDAGEPVRKLAEAEGKARSAASHEWFIAIDEKQVGPLSMEKVKDYWERGEVGPDSLCWRAGFSDWIPLSEASELASVLAPRLTKPVIVEPAPMASSAPVASGPVESAFSAGGGLSKSAKTNTPAPVGPSAQESGWKPSAASVLASLVKEENEALSKPAPKAAPVEEKKVKPAASGLLDVPPPEPAPAAAPSPLLAVPPAPAPYLQPAPAPVHAQHPAQAYAPPPAYPGYPPQAAPAPKQGGKMGMIIGVAAGVVLLVGGGVYFATRPSEQPGTVTPPAATQQQVAQAPTTAPSKPAEQPPPPAGVAQNTGTPAAGTAQPASAPTTAPSTAPAVAAGGTPGTAPATNPATPPPAEQVKPAEPPKTEPQQVARAEVPAKRNPTASRPPPTRGTSNDDEDEEPVARGKPQPKSGGSADDEFDELFGTKKPSTKNDTVSANGRTAYIPPEPGGGGGAALDRLGQSDIMQVVLANKPAIIKCVNEQKKKDPGLSGKLVMRWTVQTNGKTKNVSCQTSEFRSTYMASCISGLIKGWTFPKHKVQGEPIDFPFTF